MSIGIERLGESARAIVDEVEKAVVGKREQIELVLMTLLANGHVLIEDLPGLAKTLLGRSLAAVSGLKFTRVQFTPDLMPMDITGSTVLDPVSRTPEFRPGPVFGHLLLADEINRAPAKTQSALLEAMQERQVTVDGVSHRLEAPFLVIATQNPIDFEGTYPLPEAQVDRFLIRARLGYPDLEAEQEIVMRRAQRGRDEVELNRVVDRKTLLDMQRTVEQIEVTEPVARYAAEITKGTRESPRVRVGASPRGSLALMKVARARAAMEGRGFVTPDDIGAVAVPALAHRLILRPEFWAQDVTEDDVVEEVLHTVPTPPTVPTQMRP